jgi:hypothetical protein
VKTSRVVGAKWGLALVATLVLAGLAPAPQDDGVVLSSRAAGSQRPSHQREATAPAPTVSNVRGPSHHDGQIPFASVQVLSIRDRNRPMVASASLFASSEGLRRGISTNVRPAETVTPLSEKPVAPPLPFRVMGRYEDGGKSMVFLLQADQSWAIREGDTFSENYRVERITSNAIHLRYLPLNEVQVLEIGAAP